MGTRNFLPLKTHLDFVYKRVLKQVLCQNMFAVVGSIWDFFYTCVFCVLGFISRYLPSRLQSDDQRSKSYAISFRQDDSEIFREKEDDFLVNGEEDDKNKEENEDFVDVVPAASTNKYDFFSGNHINAYVEEPKSFTVQELFVESIKFSSDEDFPGKYTEAEALDLKEEEEETEEVVYSSEKAELPEKQEEETASETGNSSIGKVEEVEERGNFLGIVHNFPENSLFGKQDLSDEVEEPASENSSIGKVEDVEEQRNFPGIELSKMDNFPENSLFGKQDLSDEVEEPASKNSSIGKVEEIEEEGNFSGIELSKMDNFPENSLFGKEDFSDEAESTSSENYSSPSDAIPESYCWSDGSSEEDHDYDSITFEVLANRDEEHETNDSEEEYIELKPASEQKILQHEDEEEEEEKEQNNDENDSDSLWDHEDVIEQLKFELRTARTGGLPTIQEEESDFESSKSVENLNLKLKPLKIDLKLDYKDRMEEIQKFYKIYAEKMRKLDILNNQTMHAIGLLQLKDQINSNSKQKPSISLVKSFLPRKTQRSTVVGAESELKFAGKLNDDFEFVYVGQLCLSWEILRWQNQKVEELLQHQTQGFRHYNLVASEFQLFQVLLQRFVEDESFQGPRVQNYVKNRCVIRSLLYVPLVRDDCTMDKQYANVKSEEDAIFSENLVTIIVESMFTFWEFLRKDEKTMKAAQQTMLDPAHSKLLMDIRKEFQKKERKLKDIQRSGNCVVKKLQKHYNDDYRVQLGLLFAQVEMRLVSRVLAMSKLSVDQLIWCNQKLKQINFVHRKVHMETSFLLFPC